MKEKIVKLYSRLEERKVQFLDSYKSMSSDQLRFKPEPDAWNLLQVMRHIVTAEKQSLIQIQRRISRQKELPKAGLASTISYLIMKLAMNLPLKFKAPKIAEVHEERPDFEKMKEEWSSIRSEFSELISDTDAEILNAAVYKHPRAGLLSMNQALGFMINHIDHHKKQIKRIQQHPNFP